MDAPLPAHSVQPWPGPLRLGPEGIAVLGLQLPSAATGDARAQARLSVRQALAQALAALLPHPLANIHIDNRRGHAPQISLAGSHTGSGASSHLPVPHCSFAYSDHYALAALNLHGAIGVDLAPVVEIPDWQAVAHDYLGPQVCARLQRLPAAQRARAFAQAWCRLEAQLKCRGVALAEWHGERHDDAHHASLVLPQPDLAGHVVWR